MEPHKPPDGIDLSQRASIPVLSDSPKVYFDKALKFVRLYYREEMDFIAATRFEEVTPEFFFREYMWVVHATGFSAKAVGKFFPRLMLAYGPWNVAGNERMQDVCHRVCKVVNNPQKAAAVHSMAVKMCQGVKAQEWEVFRQEQLSSPELLQKLPYIGKITCYHLARNIGLLECVKPDLHLVRMAKHWGFADCEEMCKAVRPDGMPLGIVDLVFWYAASTFGTLEVRQDGDR